MNIQPTKTGVIFSRILIPPPIYAKKALPKKKKLGVFAMMRLAAVAHPRLCGLFKPVVDIYKLARGHRATVKHRDVTVYLP